MNAFASGSGSGREFVIVTGASTGIGAATARELAARGFHVLAGVRRAADADTLRATNLEPILLDITKEAEVAAVVEQITKDPERRPLRGLINNAGIGINAPVETLPIAEWRRLFDVNLFGHVSMIQALLPTLIESRGTVVNISSIGGKVAMATYGPYASSKFALEAVSDALRREVEPLGVKVVVIEPAAVRTGMLDRVADIGERITRGMTIGQRGRYAALMHAVVAQAQAAIPQGISPEAAARVIADAVTNKRPRARYTIGRNAATVVRLTRFLTDRMLDSLLSRNLKPYLVRAQAARDNKDGDLMPKPLGAGSC
jgi:NAD(P)-dependent dehydrogenase (short-subunit alcohol dehydrogenase family)